MTYFDFILSVAAFFYLIGWAYTCDVMTLSIKVESSRKAYGRIMILLFVWWIFYAVFFFKKVGKS